MQIIHVIPFISQRAGGPATFVAQLCPHLEHHGIGSKILSTNLGQVPSSGRWRTLTDDEMPPNASELDLEFFDVVSPRRLARSTGMAARLKELVPSADLVHIHSLWLHPQYVGQRVARKGNVPYVVSPHGALDPYLRRHGRAQKALASVVWQNGMFRNASAMHVTTLEELEYVADVAPHVSRAVIPIGIDPVISSAMGDAKRFRRNHLDDHDGEIVLFFGRITYKKGVDVLVRAFASLSDRLPSATLVIAGPDDENLLPGLRGLARQLGVEARVVFTGPLYGADRSDALAAADIWVLTSHTENFGIAVLEALGAGLPVIVSEGVNLARFIEERDAGVVIAQDAEVAAEAILALIKDDQRREELSRRALALATEFGWGEIAPRFADFYRSIATP